jgi:hypothetical protein
MQQQQQQSSQSEDDCCFTVSKRQQRSKSTTVANSMMDYWHGDMASGQESKLVANVTFHCKLQQQQHERWKSFAQPSFKAILAAADTPTAAITNDNNNITLATITQPTILLVPRQPKYSTFVNSFTDTLDYNNLPFGETRTTNRRRSTQ